MLTQFKHMMHKINTVLLCRHLGCHKVSLHEVLEANLVPESLGFWHEDDFGIVHHTDVPRNASDQGGHIDGASTGDHLLPVSEHGSDWRTTDMLCHGVHVLQLRQAAEEGLHEGA